MFRSIALLSTVLMLAGCAQPALRADITSFQKAEGPKPGETIAVASKRPEKAENLERRHQLETLAARLREKGFRVVQPTEQPDLFAYLDYEIDDGREVVRSQSSPIWGQTGTTTTYERASYVPPASRPGSPYTYTPAPLVPVQTPTYGVTGYSTNVYSTTEFRRILTLDIARPLGAGERGNVVYQASLQSRGSCGSLPALVGPMLEALFKDFPATTGQTRSVEVPLSKENACVR